jgi:riboflavin synthase
VFTGIVTGMGTVRSFDAGVLMLDVPPGYDEGDPFSIGESIAVNGCCLTVVAHGDGLRFDLSPETIARTSFGSLGPGSVVNLERPMRLGDRFGGHIVQGHVDAVGEIVAIQEVDNSWNFTFRVPDTYERYLIDKGSVAIDGISLTIVSPRGREFDVAIIPHTMDVTNLGRTKPGDLVNLEFDALAKHVEQLLQWRESGKAAWSASD